MTDEFALETGAIREPRVDVACLINGIPLGLVETKAFNGNRKESVADFEGYWADAPELERYAAVCVATNGFRFRAAPSGARGVSSYAEWKDTWPHEMPAAREDEDRELEIGLLRLLDPHNLADVAANFVVFETRSGVTKKKLARYQQCNPTIFIVIDRRDLDDQMNETFTACQFKGVNRATTRTRLSSLLAADARGVIITTIQKFDEQTATWPGATM